MIESQALVGVLAQGFLAAAGQLVSSGGPEALLGTIAVLAFVVLAIAAALRAEFSSIRDGHAGPALFAPAAPKGAQVPVGQAVKSPRVFTPAVKPDALKRAKPCQTAPNQIYRPSYPPVARAGTRASVQRGPGARGLSLFVERRAGVSRARSRQA